MGVALNNQPLVLRPANLSAIRFAAGQPRQEPMSTEAKTDEVMLRSRQSLLALSPVDQRTLATLNELFKKLTPEELQRLDQAKESPVAFMKEMIGSGLGVVGVPLPAVNDDVRAALQRKQPAAKSLPWGKTKPQVPTLKQIQAVVPAEVGNQLAGLLGASQSNALRTEFVNQGYGKAQTLAAIELSREIGMDVATFLGVNTGLAGEVISKVGTKEQQAVWLNAMNEGHMTYAFGLTEPTAGSDPRSMLTTFRVEKRNGKNVYILNGEKKFIGNAAQVKSEAGEVLHRGADFIVIFAVDDPGKPPEQRSYRAFMVPRTAIGEDNIVPTGGEKGKLGLKVVNNGDITLKNVEVPESFILGDPNRNMYPTLLKTLDETRLFVGAMGVGMAESFVKDSRAYAGQRHQYGKPIQGHQSVNQRINSLAADTLAARLLVMDAARRIDVAHRQQAAGQKPQNFKSFTSMAKLFSSEVAERGATVCKNTRGGNGFLEDLKNNGGMAKRFRDTQVLTVYEGTSDIQRNVIVQGEIIEAGKRFAAHYGSQFGTKAKGLFSKVTGQSAKFEAESLKELIQWLNRQQPKLSLEDAKTPVETIDAVYELASLDTLPRYFSSVQARRKELEQTGIPDKWRGWDKDSIDRELMQEALGPVQLRMHALADIAMYRHLAHLVQDELPLNSNPEQKLLLKLFLQQTETKVRQKLQYLGSEELQTEEALHTLQNAPAK